MNEPRYAPFLGAKWECQDCGAAVTDQKAHTRFHSILGAHAWALAVLQTAHINAATHAKFDTYQKIKSRRFDNWSADALAEVIRDLPPGEPS